MIPSSSPPQTASTLARLVGRVGEEATQRFWDALAIIPTPAQASQLEALLDVAPGSRFSDLDRYLDSPRTSRREGFVGKKAGAAGSYRCEIPAGAKRSWPRIPARCNRGDERSARKIGGGP